MREEAIKWRRRSRIQWLAVGDALLRYFFAQWRTKISNKTIRKVKCPDGLVVESENGIMDEIASFYRGIFTEDTLVRQNSAGRRELLQLISKRLSQQERILLDSVPDLEKIETILKDIPSNKAPSLDDLTIEVLRRCWVWLKEECMEVIQAFWQDGVLTQSTLRRVIRLIPKGGEEELLQNWWPITMMTLLYKLISKLLADRIKQFMAFLVDPQQKGFIRGRRILDNILAFRVGREHVRALKILAMAVFLDFLKAYARLDHAFLWDLLLALGFNKRFVMLVKGLLCGGTSKVHANGLFTKEFNLQ